MNNDYTYELKVRSESIIENYNQGLYSSAREAILDGIKMGMDVAQKVYKDEEALTPEEDNKYQGTVNN